MEHTKGPWGISIKEGNAGFEVYAENQPIADIRYIKGESASNKGLAIEEANACLIAAAPDLLAACEWYLHQYDSVHKEDLGETPRRIRAAVEKAKAE